MSITRWAAAGLGLAVVLGGAYLYRGRRAQSAPFDALPANLAGDPAAPPVQANRKESARTPSGLGGRHDPRRPPGCCGCPGGRAAGSGARRA